MLRVKLFNRSIDNVLINHRSTVLILSIDCLHMMFLFFLSMCLSASEHLQCWRHFVFGCVHLWVSLCILKSLWTPYLKKQWREFHSILVTDVFGFIDVLFRFCGQKVKGQGPSRQSPINRVITISL